jgi:hypothetical protein
MCCAEHVDRCYFVTLEVTTMLRSPTDQALIAALDSGLMVLGGNVRQVLYAVFERDHHVKRQEIPEHLQTFHEVLEEEFGEVAKVIERQIAKSLYARMGMTFLPKGNWTLVEYFDFVKRREIEEQWAWLRDVQKGARAWQ